MTGVVYCKVCGRVVAVGGDGITFEGSHTVTKKKKTETHSEFEKIIIKEEYDAKKYKGMAEWMKHLQEIVNEKRKK